jgi:tripartite-type tricarboxylate transporter receptor subunit TctC
MARLTLLLLTLVAFTAGSPAHAQEQYPSRPIKVIVPFGPGSATDIVIRIVGEQMRLILGQAVLVENKPGAFGIIAIEEMARSRPDGYTLQIGNSGTNALAPMVYKKKFKIDYERDVVMVTPLSEIPLVLAATTRDFPPTTYAEFIAYAKAHPGEVRYTSVGTGSNNHYDTEAFAKWTGIELVHLPNKGGGGAMTNDLLTGNAHVAFVNAASALGVIKAGEVRALAIMSQRRVPQLPGVPTLRELGYPNAKGLWSALYAPSATPHDVLEIVFATAKKALKSEAVESAFAKQMIKAIPSASLDDAQAFNRAEWAYWKKITEEVKIELAD